MKRFVRHTLLVAGREWRQLLGTPLFWVISGVFFLAASLVYVSLLLGFADPAFREENDIRSDVTIAVMHDLFYVLHYFLMVQIPMLTMRSLAEERRQHSLSLLQTTPVGEWSIVAGKFLANGGAIAAYLAMTFVFPLITALISDPDWPVVVSCYAALFLATGAYVALGLFFSSLTESQVVAAVLTYVVLFMLLIVTLVSDAIGSHSFAVLTQHITFDAHIDGFLAGNIVLADVAYFVLFGSVFLFFTVRHLESMRWRG